MIIIWILSSDAYLLPSLAPMDEADPLLTLGVRTIQVRARLTSHLENYIDNILDPNGLDHSEIEQTPWADYNCRLYVTQDVLAQSLALMALRIDYTHFKSTSAIRNAAGGYKYGRDAEEYHRFLNKMWGVSCELNEPGGFYGPKSDANPNGYEPAYKYTTFAGEHKTVWDDEPIGSSFLAAEFETHEGYAKTLIELAEVLPYEDWDREFDDEDMDLLATEFTRGYQDYARWKANKMYSETKRTRRGKRAGKKNRKARQ